jgi:hypothetical protein
MHSSATAFFADPVEGSRIETWKPVSNLAHLSEAVRIWRKFSAIDLFYACCYASASGRLLMGAIARFWSDESGATAVEYGLLAALISVF